MESLPLPPSDGTKLVIGSADVTVGPTRGDRPGARVAKGAHQARLIFPGSTDPRFHIAVTKVPAVVNFATLCARGAALVTWLFTKTETMRVPDPNNPGQFIKVYVSLESLRKRVHIPEAEARAKFRADRQQAATGGAASEMRALINQKAEARAKGVEDFVTLYCRADASGILTVKETGQCLGLTAKELSAAVSTAEAIRMNGKRSAQFTVKRSEQEKEQTLVVVREAGKPMELYVIPNETIRGLQDPSQIPVRNILSPSSQRTYTIYSNQEHESQEIEASALKNSGEPPIEVLKKIGMYLERAVGHLEIAYTDTAESLARASPQQKLSAFKDGLGSTLSSLARRHATKGLDAVYQHTAIDRRHLVNSNGQWKLLGGTAADIVRPNYEDLLTGTAGQKQDVAALAKSWAQVITGQEDPAMDLTLSTAFTRAGLTREESGKWAKLLMDMSKSALTAAQARDKAAAILTPTDAPLTTITSAPTKRTVTAPLPTRAQEESEIFTEGGEGVTEESEPFNGTAFDDALNACLSTIRGKSPNQDLLRKNFDILEKQLRLMAEDTRGFTVTRRRRLRTLLSQLELPKTEKLTDPGATAKNQEQYTYFESVLQHFSTEQEKWGGLRSAVPPIVKKKIEQSK